MRRTRAWLDWPSKLAAGPVAQWIEQRTSNPCAEVRFLPGPLEEAPAERAFSSSPRAFRRLRVCGYTEERIPRFSGLYVVIAVEYGAIGTNFVVTAYLAPKPPDGEVEILWLP